MSSLVRASRSATHELITGRPAFVSFQTLAELRYGAIRRGRGSGRMLRWTRRSSGSRSFTAAPSSSRIYAQLRANCEAAGQALGQKAHTGDRWVAATAIRLGIPLVSNDGIFRDAPGPELGTLAIGLRTDCRRSGMFPSGTRDAGAERMTAPAVGSPWTRNPYDKENPRNEMRPPIVGNHPTAVVELPRCLAAARHPSSRSPWTRISISGSAMPLRKTT
ncbi:MAG: PIN domain-containing protein [Solirubrobacterales bacterium]|nr:PIN domain-containing protein [Solirubrobacterales bacterium]MBV9801271.1 PIN domain-containing protein [Solirubrobacterales bacterium]